jgi:hypothetical protein
MQARRKQFKSGGGGKFFERETTDNVAREIAQKLLGKQYKKRERRELEICRITNSYFVGRGGGCANSLYLYHTSLRENFTTCT